MLYCILSFIVGHAASSLNMLCSRLQMCVCTTLCFRTHTDHVNLLVIWRSSQYDVTQVLNVHLWSRHRIPESLFRHCWTDRKPWWTDHNSEGDEYTSTQDYQGTSLLHWLSIYPVCLIVAIQTKIEMLCYVTLSWKSNVQKDAYMTYILYIASNIYMHFCLCECWVSDFSVAFVRQAVVCLIMLLLWAWGL